MSEAAADDDYVDRMNLEYERLHTAKEDAFWIAYMGLSDDPDAAQAALNEREIEVQQWLQDPARLAEVRRRNLSIQECSKTNPEPVNPVRSDTIVALAGWQRTLEAHAIDSAGARALSAELVHLEGDLARGRSEMKLGYQVDGEDFVPASSVRLGNMLRSEPSERMRKAAWEGMRSIENHVLAHGFIEIIKKRNELGRMLGGEDYYDWKVKRVEGMSKHEIFALLDELNAKTKQASTQSLDRLRTREGAGRLTPWNIQYLVAGDVTKLLDPYFPFPKSFQRWGASFSKLGVDYRGATLVLDLLDRKGKYENGFMHGPVPAWSHRGEFRKARIHFTANAIQGQIGAGHRSMATFLHEGGHAAHFANVEMPSPCFAQEFAPTSVAFAEIQSMFMDNMMNDGDWLVRYARDEKDQAIPFALIEQDIQARQPFAAWTIRSWMAVPYAERAIYELSDDELTPENILSALRRIETEMVGLAEGSSRPVLSVPHLLSGESSAYYHGYIMAEMGVHQTRRHFLERDGFLVDNPKIGPELAEQYWRPGNSLKLNEFLTQMTGAPLSADDLAVHVNRSVEDAIDEARSAAGRVNAAEVAVDAVDLNADIQVVDGNDLIADTSHSFSDCANRFEAWLSNRK